MKTQQTIKLTGKAASIALFKIAKANVAKKGWVILPSVLGPYVYDPFTERCIGRYGSKEYDAAIK